MTQGSRQHAFTLVELIAALAITVLVTGSAAAILHVTTAARVRVDRQAGVQQQADAAMRAIVAALGNVHRPTDGSQPWLEGKEEWLGDMPSHRVRFFTVSRRTIRPDQPESDVRECEFCLSEPQDGQLPRLLRRTDPTRNNRPDNGGVVEVVAENVVGLAFDYHDGRAWRTDWPQSLQSWPLAIRVHLVLVEPERGEQWPLTRLVSFPHMPRPEREEPE